MAGEIRALNKPKRFATEFTAKKTSTKKGEITLYGTIGESWWGDGVSAKKFTDELKKLGAVDEIDLFLNSDGGVVTEARTMYNRLVEHQAKVRVHIDGIAASAASFLAMAGDEIIIAEGAFFMIHNARGVAVGQAADMRRMADVLETVNRTIVDTYAARTGNKSTDLKKWMDAETYFTGKEALDKGFATSMTSNKGQVAACVTPWLVNVCGKTLPIPLRPNRARAAAILAEARKGMTV